MIGESVPKAIIHNLIGQNVLKIKETQKSRVLWVCTGYVTQKSWVFMGIIWDYFWVPMSG